MIRSVPSSPDPESFRVNKPGNKTNQEHPSPGLKHLSQMKYLHKLPHMSPKLKKFFSMRTTRKTDREEIRRNSDSGNISSDSCDAIKLDKVKKNENGIRKPPTSLHIIKERDQSDCDPENKRVEAEKDNGGTKLAELVINLLKTKRQIGGYSSVGTDDTEDEFSEIKIDNLHEITNITSERKQNSQNKNNTSNSNKANRSPSDATKERRLSDKFFLRRQSAEKSSANKKKELLTLPRIILTKDNDRTVIRYLYTYICIMSAKD